MNHLLRCVFRMGMPITYLPLRINCPNDDRINDAPHDLINCQNDYRVCDLFDF